MFNSIFSCLLIIFKKKILGFLCEENVSRLEVSVLKTRLFFILSSLLFLLQPTLVTTYDTVQYEVGVGRPQCEDPQIAFTR